MEYFVSYYDYYQPEAYVPSSDTYIAKAFSVPKPLWSRPSAVQPETVMGTLSCMQMWWQILWIEQAAELRDKMIELKKNLADAEK